MSPHLYVALSGHGFGHLAQVAPLLNAWQQRFTHGRLTLQSALSADTLRKRIRGEFTVVNASADFGMLMVDALEVKVAESVAAYRAFHAQWEQHLAWQEQLLRAAAPHLILADIPYLTLAAAANLHIPALALCSLNWADILQDCAGAEFEVSAMCALMREAYNSARAFLQPAPAMPMRGLHHAHSIGPLADLGQQRRMELKQGLGLRADDLVVCVALGGVDMRPPLEQWPQQPRVYWLTPPHWQTVRHDLPHWGRFAAWPMLDVMRSCDVLLTKPGYGAFTEAACNQMRTIYVARDTWPEEPWLGNWLLAHGNAVKISRAQLHSGELAAVLDELLAQPLRPAVVPSGIDQALEWLAACL